jgi:Tfp pilus assembly protein PilN
MKTVNLIITDDVPISYRRILSIFIWIVLAIGLGYGFLYLRNYRLESKSENLAEELDILKEEQRKFVEKLQKEEKKIQKKGQEALQERFSNLPSWAPLLREVASKLPAEIWLTSMQATQEESQTMPTILLRGVTPHTSQLTELLSLLDNSIYVKNPTLSETHVSIVGGKPAYQFTINCEGVPL